MKKNSNLIIIILTLLVITLLSTTIFFANYDNKETGEIIENQEELKLEEGTQNIQPCQLSQDIDTSDWTLLTNSERNISFKYPDNWEEIHNTDEIYLKGDADLRITQYTPENYIYYYYLNGEEEEYSLKTDHTYINTDYLTIGCTKLVTHQFSYDNINPGEILYSSVIELPDLGLDVVYGPSNTQEIPETIITLLQSIFIESNITPTDILYSEGELEFLHDSTNYVTTTDTGAVIYNKEDKKLFSFAELGGSAVTLEYDIENQTVINVEADFAEWQEVIINPEIYMTLNPQASELLIDYKGKSLYIGNISKGVFKGDD